MTDRTVGVSDDWCDRHTAFLTVCTHGVFTLCPSQINILTHTSIHNAGALTLRQLSHGDMAVSSVSSMAACAHTHAERDTTNIVN